MDIDWSKAPEWAEGCGIAGHHVLWVGNSQYAYITKPSEVFDWSDNPRCISHRHRSELTELIKRPATWNGSGLPPVGTVCEFAGGTPCPEDPFDKDLKEGMKVTIIAHFKCGDFTLAAFTFDPENPDRGMVQVEQGNFGCFRPIRTPEQIAAEEREAGIENLLDWVAAQTEVDRAEVYRKNWAVLYDAGLRPPVQP